MSQPSTRVDSTKAPKAQAPKRSRSFVVSRSRVAKTVDTRAEKTSRVSDVAVAHGLRPRAVS